jgi:predicted Zn finger-like uncharacterized protein
MLIICPSCATSYDVELASLGARGRQVRCVRCRDVWHAMPTQADKLLAAAEALAPARAGATDAAEPFIDEAVAITADRNDRVEPLAYDPANDQRWDGTLEAQSDAAVDETFSAWPNQADVEAPPIAPVDLDEGQPPIEIDADDFAEHRVEPRDDVESVAARRSGHRGTRAKALWPLSPMQSGILALLLLDCVLIGWRSDFVRALPQTASFYAMIGLPVNLRGLAFDGVSTATEQHEGVPILVVEGNVVNAAGKSVDVPRLKFIVRNAVRQEIYSWTAVPSRNMLPPGEAVAFRTRLASPPPDGRDVVVRFVSRRDIVGTTH